ncbi:Rieske (2Fe-2S) protein [Telmatospirillum siberiense]|uniref:(2Fe-2S)-binding protein n=1 Tax=Telmatospirillum siberiense TaxID=382514 RepID=A0A2N3PSU1_9PROT|nr:Rieske (2Fe-2S) protein [Telmatospirillum siberiense]PKU23454.1 (2Fe-2S)-binding protein [Telmatospirillum siberiense]
MKRALCRLDELEDPGSAAFTFGEEDLRRAGLIVRRGGSVFAYLNNCPHNGSPLDWQAGRFLDLDRRFILCATHGASFRIEDGFCLGGPCAGKSLTPVPVTLADGTVWLEDF